MLRVWAALILLGGCSAPHVDLSLTTANCSVPSNTAGLPCQSMTLGCANFFELVMYEHDLSGRILQSSCLSATEVDTPQDLCALTNANRAPTLLLDGLASGEVVQFMFRAIDTSAPADRCNTEILTTPDFLTVFQGYSATVQIDGKDHIAPIELRYCGSCASISPVGGPCPPGKVPNTMPLFPNAPMCCPVLPSGTPCPAPGTTCSDGTLSVVGPGDCCASCV